MAVTDREEQLILEDVMMWITNDQIESVLQTEFDHYKSKVHNWRNYVHDGMKELWPELTDREKLIIFSLCEKQADNEEWD